MPSRMCSARSPSITAPVRVSSCQVPAPGVMTNELPPRRAMPAWNEASVRRLGFMNKRPSTLPARACGRGERSRRLASATRSRTATGSKSARSMKRFIVVYGWTCLSEPLQRGGEQIDLGLLEGEWRQQAQHVRIAAGAGEDVLFHQRLLQLAGRHARDESGEETRALVAGDGADDAGVADVPCDAPHVGQQVFLLDGIDAGLHGGGGHG